MGKRGDGKVIDYGNGGWGNNIGNSENMNVTLVHIYIFKDDP